MKQTTCAVLAGLALSCPVHAASFDCAKVQTQVEKLVCTDAELSKLDEEVAGRYKAALMNRTNADATKRVQKVWLEERDKCIDAKCIKQSYKNWNATLREDSVSYNAVKCADENMREHSRIRAEDIVGMYQQPVNLPPNSAFSSDKKSSGYNSLTITENGGNRLHIKLATQEIDGHECGLDNDALLCGRKILIVPSEEEKMSLERTRQTAPILYVSSQSIKFAPLPDGTFSWGYPYCGMKGGLNHNFKRSSRIQ